MSIREIGFQGSVGVFDPFTSAWKKLQKMTVYEDGTFEDVKGIESGYDDVSFDFYLLPGFIDAHCHLLETPYYSEPSSKIWNVSKMI